MYTDRISHFHSLQISCSLKSVLLVNWNGWAPPPSWTPSSHFVPRHFDNLRMNYGKSTTPTSFFKLYCNSSLNEYSILKSIIQCIFTHPSMQRWTYIHRRAHNGNWFTTAYNIWLMSTIHIHIYVRTYIHAYQSWSIPHILTFMQIAFPSAKPTLFSQWTNSSSYYCEVQLWMCFAQFLCDFSHS